LFVLGFPRERPGLDGGPAPLTGAFLFPHTCGLRNQGCWEYERVEYMVRHVDAAEGRRAAWR